MVDLSPWMIDAILIGVALEFLLLRAFLAKANAHHLIALLFFFLMSGGFLLAAVRLALTNAPQAFIALALLSAFVSHAILFAMAARRFLPERPVSE